MHKEIQAFTEDGVFTIVPKGSLEGEVAQYLQNYLLSDESTSAAEVVIDLKDTAVVTADGVRVLLNAHIESQVSGKKLQLTNPNHKVSALLTTIGLTDIIA